MVLPEAGAHIAFSGGTDPLSMEVHAMSETGRNIVDGFRELRKFCGEAALLLKTADGLMQDAD